MWGNFLDGRRENIQCRVDGSNDKLEQHPEQGNYTTTQSDFSNIKKHMWGNKLIKAGVKIT